jgi:hypothetical protein
MKVIYLFAALLISSMAFGQNLLPSINTGVLPNDSDPVCPTPFYSNLDFDTSGYDVGETVNDFTLFDRNGNGYQLSNALSLGKPVLLITGSLTCPVFRSQMPTINTVFTTYAADVNTAIIYTIEAHPTDTSPYSGTINITTQNINQGILFPQPTTYGERKALVDTLLQNMTVSPPVYIDGPCNEWWNKYGPAPQNAYLIDTNGTVLLKHGWFDQFPQDIFCDIDSVLGITSGNCNPPTTNGSFIFAPLVTNVYGFPGQTIYATGDLINNSLEDVLIAVVKLQEIYAPGWNSAFCMDICYSTTVDSTTIRLAPNDTMHFSLDFFTSLTPDSSRVRVGFRNLGFPSNQFSQWFKGNTNAVAVMEQASEGSFTIYPNPCSSVLHFVSNTAYDNYPGYFIYDMNGKLQKTIAPQNQGTGFSIDVSDLNQGVYFIEHRGVQYSSYVKFVKH